MNTLAVPAALPRCAGGTSPKIAANTAGVRSALPTASTTTPARRLHTSGTEATITSPAPHATSAPAARRSGGMRSGSLANRIRHVTTTTP